ncbi:MAG TPA: DUF3800 domain-containing protein [Pirellulales bacterium]|nr:DUF3800 domain-containing protein [Pirellulales bacterium]
MAFRIYVDESGTQSEQWLIIGMLFVPTHGPLHADLCKAKDEVGYLNSSPKRSSKYKETHLADFRSPRDVEVGRRWVDLFLRHDCYFRAVVVDWSIWDGSYFGDPFEPESLQKRRAYKKWAEMLLHPEIKEPVGGREVYHARLYLDRLRIMYGYDVLEHLRERFTKNYRGESPHIEQFQHTDSWHDANQCLQLCDLLTGCLYQSLIPSAKAEKRDMRAYLERRLNDVSGIKQLSASFWKQYHPTTLTKHFPKFSAWFWQPTKKPKQKKRRR